MNDTHKQLQIRLWPGVLFLVLQWFARFVVPLISADAAMYGLVGGVFIGSAAIALWWLFFSRLPWSERLGGIGFMIAGILLTPFLLHESIKTGGMGMMFIIFVLPVLSLALVGWGFLSRYVTGTQRWITLAACIFMACGIWTLLRTEGATGEFDQDFAFRWSDTHEQRLLAESPDETLSGATAEAAETEAQWPGFLGANRDGVVQSGQIATDWEASPPVEMWRRSIGPGWSSFAVGGDLFYTQEQRGEHEVVACYRLSNGEPVWRHQDADRFWESIGGAGPRSTPTLHNGHLYTIGGNGIVNALNALDGSVVWSRNTVTDTGVEIPGWGISGSPLVYQDLLLVPASGTLIAYDLASGEIRWKGPSNGTSYSSPQLANIDGVDQILFLNATGLNSVAPADGSVLWTHEWDSEPIVQPTFTADGDILIHAKAQSGLRRLSVSKGESGWSVEERWFSRNLKPYYSEFMVHNDLAIGFDGSLLSCIDVNTGERKWKGGRYGAGQLFLIANQNLLVVLSEKGELILVSATGDQLNEMARFKAIEGKTWNHPVLAGDVLLVRNAKEMAAFRLPQEGGASPPSSTLD